MSLLMSYAKLNDTVNSSFNLGEKFPESRIVRKIMRSLLERFKPKVTALEENKDIDSVKIEELIGSLQTYELSLPQSKKGKSIVFKTIKVEANGSSEEDSLNDEDLALFLKRFKNFFQTTEEQFKKQIL
jgi:hypothetical protein